MSYLISPILKEIPYLEHGFFTRIGGVSSGCYATLNTSFKKGDDPKFVYENLHRICKIFNLSLKNLCIVRQMHTNIVHIVTEPFINENIPIGDALVTLTPNLLIGIKTADCVPILLADKILPIVAAVHAGWKGAINGIIENTINIMKEKGAKHIVAALGPCIWQESYEVDQKFKDNLNDSELFFTAGNKPDHYQFDLPGYVINRLNKNGVKNISSSPANTFTDEVNFFSYRYKIATNKDDIGNQLSIIYIKK